MDRLGFGLVWLGLLWFGRLPCLKKNYGEFTGGQRKVNEEPSGKKKLVEKRLAGKTPNVEKSYGKRQAGKRPARIRPSNSIWDAFFFQAPCF